MTKEYKFPRLYLELLENKNKVKSELMFEEFVDTPTNSPVTSIKNNSAVEISRDIVKLSESPQKILEESLLQDIFEDNTQALHSSPVQHVIPQPEPAQLNQKQNIPPLKEVIPKEIYDRYNLAQNIPPVKKLKSTISTNQDPQLLINKQQLLIKFDILRKDATRTIPMYTLDHDYDVMKKHYKMLVKQLHVDNKVTFYKQCLLGLCGCVELGMGEMGLGLDMEGYTEFQANSMNKYEKLLVKIGEKSYMPASIISLPVEMQLCITIILQTIIFISTKMLKNKIGFNLATLFQGIPENTRLEMPK